MLKSSTSVNDTFTALDFVFKQEYDKEKEMEVGLAVANDPLVFKQKTADSARVVSEVFGGGGLFTQRANEEAELPQANRRSTNNRSLTVLEFDQAVSIPKNFADDDQHELVAGNLTEMAYAARESADDYNLDRYALGFTTVTANSGTAYYSNSHTAIDGTTVDNLNTGTMSAANLETLLVLLGRQKNESGTLGHFHAKLLLVPYNLIKEACEVVDSDYLSGTGNNNTNYLSKKYPGLEVKFSAVLDDTSTTAYFLASSRHSMSRYVRESLKTNYIDWSISKAKVGSYQAWFREVTAPLSYAGAAASDGTV